MLKYTLIWTQVAVSALYNNNRHTWYSFQILGDLMV